MTKNVAASVRARLQNQAKADNRPFQEVLQYYGLERFLYRFSRSRHRDRFVLKSALMLRVWQAPASRPTRDIDFLGYIANEIDPLENLVREVCTAEVEDDGLRFDPCVRSFFRSWLCSWTAGNLHCTGAHRGRGAVSQVEPLDPSTGADGEGPETTRTAGVIGGARAGPSAHRGARPRRLPRIWRRNDSPERTPAPGWPGLRREFVSPGRRAR